MRLAPISILAFIVCSAGCDDCEKIHQNNACTSVGPIQDVNWIAKLIDETMTDCSCEHSIIRGTYEGQTVIFVALTDAACDGIDTPTIYDCEGTAIRSFSDSPADQAELHEKVTRDAVLYRCKT